MPSINLIDHLMHSAYLENAQFEIISSELVIKTGLRHSRDKNKKKSCLTRYLATHDLEVTITSEHCTYCLIVGMGTKFDSLAWDWNDTPTIDNLRPEFFLDEELVLNYSSDLNVRDESVDGVLEWLNSGAGSFKYEKEGLRDIDPPKADKEDKEQQLRYAIAIKLNDMINSKATPSDIQSKMLNIVGKLNHEWVNENLKTMQEFSNTMP